MARKRAPILIHDDAYVREAASQSLEDFNVKECHQMVNRQAIIRKKVRHVATTTSAA